MPVYPFPTPEPPTPPEPDPEAARVTPLPVVLPPYLVGETVQLLVTTDHGTDAVSGQILHLNAYPDGWHLTVCLSEQRCTFNLVPLAADPVAEPCPGCGADAGEECRWGCLGPVSVCNLSRLQRIARRAHLSH